MLSVDDVAESLYNHWKRSSYELKRQPEWSQAPSTLRSVFLRQGEAVVGDFYGKDGLGEEN